jgi:hypothetical protein
MAEDRKQLSLQSCPSFSLLDRLQWVHNCGPVAVTEIWQLSGSPSTDYSVGTCLDPIDFRPYPKLVRDVALDLANLWCIVSDLANGGPQLKTCAVLRGSKRTVRKARGIGLVRYKRYKTAPS